MPQNDFLPFATAPDANVSPQSEYSTLGVLKAGFASGVARSQQMNKVWRQSSIMSAVLADFIVDQSGQAAIDDGSTATLEASLLTAIRAAARTQPILNDTGSAGAYAVANTPALSTLPQASGLLLRVNIAHANLGASTLSVDGLDAKPIYGRALAALQGGELAVGIASFMWVVAAALNSGNGAWVLLESQGGAIQTPVATQSGHAVNLGQMQSTLAGISVAPAPTNLLHPSLDGGWRDIYRAGWLPGWFNQQWGGAQVGTEICDAATGVMYKFEPATGNVQDDGWISTGNVTTDPGYFSAEAFKVAESTPIAAVWLKLYKLGNPTQNLGVDIYTDNGSGKPNTSISTGSIALKILTSKSDGEWYRVPVSDVTLAPGITYHLVIHQPTADVSNYLNWKSTTNKRYPHGNYNAATSAMVWTAYPHTTCCFMVEPVASNLFLRPGGLFEQRLVFAQGSPVNQSKLLTQSARNFFDGKSGSLLYRGSVSASSTLKDIAWGLDHDRIVLTTNAQGYPVLTLYSSDHTVFTVTGSTSIAVGQHDIAAGYRCVGDGQDYLKLIVDGVEQGQALTAQTFVMSEGWRDQATAWLGGGFPLAPNWNAGSLQSFASLPSVNGWTWVGTAIEANAMTASGGKLFQNRNGYASTDNGYYSTVTAFNNAVGWAVEIKLRVAKNTNTPRGAGVHFAVLDGTYGVGVEITENYLQSYGAGTDFTIQGDFKSQEHVFTLCGRGQDYYVLVDHRLVIDGTGKLSNPAALNKINFGDGSATAGENADAIWAYLKFTNTGMLLPQAANGAVLSEFGYWSGEQSAILPQLFNGEAPVSIKKQCGLSQNYINGPDAGIQRSIQRGITNGGTTASTVSVPLPEMEQFTIGTELDVQLQAVVGNAAAATNTYTYTYVDGEVLPDAVGNYVTPQIGGSIGSVVTNSRKRSYLGLHKVDARWCAGASTSNFYGIQRNLTVSARS